MVFEIGKYYEHKGGEQLYICAKIKTHLYGECLIAETGRRKTSFYSPNKYIRYIHKNFMPLLDNNKIEGYFKPVGMDEMSSSGYYEIRKEEFMLNNFELGSDRVKYERILKINKLHK